MCEKKKNAYENVKVQGTRGGGNYYITQTQKEKPRETIFIMSV